MKTKKDGTTAGATPFARFQRLIRGLVAVPKKEIEAEEARWRANRATKRKRADG